MSKLCLGKYSLFILWANKLLSIKTCNSKLLILFREIIAVCFEGKYISEYISNPTRYTLFYGQVYS